MSEEQLNEMLENIENAFWYLKNCKCNVDVTTKGHKWETYYGLDSDLIKYIRKIENQLQQNKNIIKEVRKLINYYGITPEQNDDTTCRSILKQFLDILDKENKYINVSRETYERW